MADVFVKLKTAFRFFASATLSLVALCAVASFTLSGVAKAQTADGYVGWTWAGINYDTPEEACRAKWEGSGMNNGYSRFIGAVLSETDWSVAHCQWTSYQYLCPQETGGGLNECWTVLPSIVLFSCATGYTKTADGHCRLNPEVEQPCECDKDGQFNPTTGHPIVISTGAKVLTAEDYATADGRFRIGRHYRSFQVGRPIDGVVLPRSQPRGLVGGWNFDLGYEIQLGNLSGSPSSPNAKVAILAPDGTGFGFVLQSNGQWILDPSISAANLPQGWELEFVGTLPANLADIALSSSTWTFTDGDDTVWTLQTRVGPNGGKYLFGWPNSMVARDGYDWTYAYNSDSSLASITDSFGRTATFTWNMFKISTLVSPPAGSLPSPLAISSIALPDGTSLHYTYDPPLGSGAGLTSWRRRLAKVERRSAANAVLDSVGYRYDSSLLAFRTHVTGIVDNRGVRTRNYGYANSARALQSEGPDGTEERTILFTQNGGGAPVREVTNALGKTDTYTFSASGSNEYRLTQIAGAASANTPASTTSFGYGTNGFITSTTDGEGRVTSFVRDARGRPTSITEADGTTDERTTEITWHSTFNVPTTIERPDLIETRTYTSTGQLETVTLEDTTTQTVPYSTNGQTRTWTYDWDANGLLLSIDGPLAPDAQSNDDITSFTYDTAGNLLTATDPLGHVTAYDDHDANGRPGTMTDPNGVVTAFTYDPLGRIQTVTARHPTNSTLNAVTTIAYDAVGQVIGLTLPSTDALIMDYDDAGRLISMRAASGERWDYAYDKEGNVTRETVKRGDGSTSLRIARAFDELSRTLSETVGTGHLARWGYDKVSNVVSETSPNGFETTSAFDALDRVIETVAPDSGITELAYDDNDNLTSHTDPISVTTEFVYNGFGEVIQETSPDRGTSTYSYDAAGRMLQSTDGRGQVIDYTRDYLGRMTSKVPQSRPASETIEYVWDTGGLSGSYGVGRLAKVIDGSGTTLFQHDHRGNLTAKQQTIGTTSAAQLAYEYDLADRITQITYPSGRLVKYTYDSKGRVSSIETKASASVSSWTTLSSGYSYEPFGEVAGMTLGNGLAVANQWGTDGLLASRRLFEVSSGANLSHLSYSHDADGNIGAITDHVTPANSAVYGYDEVGRLTLAVTDASTTPTQSYSYTSGTNQLASMTDAAGTRNVTYDGRGNTASEIRPGSVTVTTEYDGHGRLTGYDRTGVGASDFTYNGLHDRVMMALATAGTRRFVYDADGRVMGEYGTSAADVKAEFIWALPQVGVTGPFGGGDGIGGYAPLAVATPDTTGTIQLNWVHGNHLGVPLVVTGASGGAPITPNDYLAPGFPGQSRVLGDLYYNRYRDYDPVTGRYIQADPIGLDGGSNPYLYAEGNPVNVIDPDGLQARSIPGILPGIPMPPLPGTVGPYGEGNPNLNDMTEQVTLGAQRRLRRLGEIIEECIDDYDDPNECSKALAEAHSAYYNLMRRIRAYQSSRTPDVGHFDAISEARDRLRAAIRWVRRVCKNTPPEMLKWEAASIRPVPRRH